MDELNELIWIKAGRNAGRGKVGVAEADTAHPRDALTGEREIFVYDGGPAVLVAPTPRVLQALSDGKAALATQADVTAAKSLQRSLVERNNAYQARVVQQGGLPPLPLAAASPGDLPPHLAAAMEGGVGPKGTYPPAAIVEAMGGDPASLGGPGAARGSVLESLVEGGQEPVTEKRADYEDEEPPASPTATPLGGRGSAEEAARAGAPQGPGATEGSDGETKEVKKGR